MATAISTRTARRVMRIGLAVLFTLVGALWLFPPESTSVVVVLASVIGLLILGAPVWTMAITEWIWDRRRARAEPIPDVDVSFEAAPEIAATWEPAGASTSGGVITIRFVGLFPPGSGGNTAANAMVRFAEKSLAESKAAGVILDFTALDYTFGDAIGGVAKPLLVDRARFRPAAIVAVAATAAALEPLLAPNVIFGIAGIKMFPTVQDALAHVQARLDIENRGGLRQ